MGVKSWFITTLAGFHSHLSFTRLTINPRTSLFSGFCCQRKTEVTWCVSRSEPLKMRPWVRLVVSNPWLLLGTGCMFKYGKWHEQIATHTSTSMIYIYIYLYISIISITTYSIINYYYYIQYLYYICICCVHTHALGPTDHLLQIVIV